jgi:hypothetical protein
MSFAPTAPILFLIFNRPDLTQKVFERIREIQPSQLFIAADGPRGDRHGEDLLCAEARAITENIDWECELHRLERSENLGCKVAVSTAITWFFEHVEEGIILEDDCLPDASFFQFCSEMLDRYRFDSRVGVVGGNYYQPKSRKASYYFSRYPQIWGWATWKRLWSSYDVDLTDWNGRPESLATSVKRHRVRKRFAGRFDSVKSGNCDTWDHQLVHLCLKTSALCISPTVNLVENIGFDERATHTYLETSPLPAAYSLKFPLVHPVHEEIDESADYYTETHVLKVPPNIFAKWLNSFEKRLARIKSRRRERRAF